jgi:hypothetical protein
MSSNLTNDSAMSKDDPNTISYLAKPSGATVLRLAFIPSIHDALSRLLRGGDLYLHSTRSQANGHILLYFADVWGMFPNGLLIVDGFADARYNVLGLDYFRSDPVWKHRKSRVGKETEPGFD